MVRPIKSFGFIVFVSLSLTGRSAGAASSSSPSSSSSNPKYYLNVYGQPLRSCSSNGMALTGYTRTGYCVDRNDDEGSHHICIDLSSTVDDDNNGGGGGGDSSNTGNFCDVTGQYDWCSSQDMECDTINDGGGNGGGGGSGNGGGGCAIQNWCVCQWAFASYLDKAGGCDSIQTIVCESINLEAVLAYQEQSSYEKYNTALQCIVDRCGLDINNIPVRQQQQKQQQQLRSSRYIMGFLITVMLLASFAFGGVLYFMKKRRGGPGNLMDYSSRSGLLSS
eukprot:CAMPEP_0113475432 /NCGR_PEP_ID=MMETSP0014_2-20120614/19117_1 /TAXON_ID=2857 /ORGANISM="Nitzschia sp." /LENGTH=277 /DNA_ID=CAMNT_0000368351 /DNA_START=107 /DNA_END=940 /DNA_ORIENTATION=+ /assembly_acc=CAM_ASM_000159